jgi:hypothetical protein
MVISIMMVFKSDLTVTTLVLAFMSSIASAASLDALNVIREVMIEGPPPLPSPNSTPQNGQVYVYYSEQCTGMVNIYSTDIESGCTNECIPLPGSPKSIQVFNVVPGTNPRSIQPRAVPPPSPTTNCYIWEGPDCGPSGTGNYSTSVSSSDGCTEPEIGLDGVSMKCYTDQC